MSQGTNRNGRTRQQIYEDSLSGAQDRPPIPRLRSDKTLPAAPTHSLQEFREQEGRENRKRRLKALWKHICKRGYNFQHEANVVGASNDDMLAQGFTLEKAKKLRAAYEDELYNHLGGQRSTSPRTHIGWKEFKAYAEAKEVGTCSSSLYSSASQAILELWAIFHDELDLDGNGHLDASELDLALAKSGMFLL